MIELKIKESLAALQKAITAGDSAGVKRSMSVVDDILSERRQELDPQLKHYLKNRSYLKALAYLDGDADIPKGRCGGRTDFS